MAIFGRRTARRRLRNTAGEVLTIPAFSVPVDCSAWVLDDVWPPELATTTPQTTLLAEYLNVDLQRIVNSANSKLQEIGWAGLAGADRQAAETRVVEGARAFAVRRVESTVRQLRRDAPRHPAVRPMRNPPPARASPATPASPITPTSRITPALPAAPAPTAAPASSAASISPAAPAPPETPAANRAAESAEQRLRRLLQSVARQEPGLRWAVGACQDGSVLLVTDIAHGWIPPGIELPGGVRLLAPGRRDRSVTALLGDTVRSTAYMPGDRLGWAGESGRTEPSREARTLPAIDDIGRLLVEAARGRAGFSRVADILVKAGAPGTGVADAELDLLRVHLDTVRYRLLAQYPAVDEALLLDCMLLSASEAIVTGDQVTANYHCAWFRALTSPPAGNRGKNPS